jgi:uncharacterized membrane protein YozB (DUF420 family)
MDISVNQKDRGSLVFINVLSVVIPILVVGLLSLENKLDLGGWTKSLSHAIGLINTATTVLLIAGLIFIKQNKPARHRAVMTAAFALGGVFLVCYVLYPLCLFVHLVYAHRFITGRFAAGFKSDVFRRHGANLAS